MPGLRSRRPGEGIPAPEDDVHFRFEGGVVGQQERAQHRMARRMKSWLPWNSPRSGPTESGLPREEEWPRHHARAVEDRPGEGAGESVNG